MDVVNAQIHSQSSICSESTGDEAPRNTVPAPLDRRICLVGELQNDEELVTAAKTFGVPVVNSSDGHEFVDEECTTVFIVKQFEGDVFTLLSKSKQCLLGPTALQQLAKKKEALPFNTRPLFNLAMSGVVLCLTGFRVKDELTKLVPLIHHMGGSIRKDVSSKVTHLIANTSGGDKYHYASIFRVPIMNLNWVFASWEKRHDMEFSATQDTFIAEHKLKPFHGAKVCFFGFPEDEEKHMTEVLLQNGGSQTTIDDPACTHVVVDESTRTEKPETGKAWIVKAEWFWTSVQKEVSLQEKEYLVDDQLDNVLSPNRRDSHLATPTSQSRRKRKRLQNDLISSLTLQSPSLHKRRSSVSDAGLLSVSGSFLDCTQSPDKVHADGTTVVESPKKPLTARHQVFLELVHTEKNYVSILETILNLFKKELEEMTEENCLLNNTELNLIFGKLPLIYETHSLMFKEFEFYLNSWTEDAKIGDTIVKFSTNLLKAYPPFINYFEEMKETIVKCDNKNPRFHAFLKAKLSKPECGRQTLQELMIRPVQRLGSMSLLLNDILKHTPKTNPDHASLDQALAALREVMTHINEDKRKAESQVMLFTIFNEIDNCPPDIVSSHRNYIAKTEVVQLNSSEGLASKGSHLVLYLFSDQLEVCKKKSKAFNSLKSPSSVSSLQSSRAASKYKHVRLLPLNTIKKVVNVAESEDCENVFSLLCRSNDEIKERLWSFQVEVDDEVEKDKADNFQPMNKVDFIKTLCKQMADNSCTTDPDKFLAHLEAHQLDIDTNDLNNGTLSKAFKFATRTRLKVGRAFSFNKTPSKLKRAMSSMMSPFGSSTNLTPASQLAQMRLASYNNINELGNAENAQESPPIAPMSVQPTRKMKSASLGVNALKRL